MVKRYKNDKILWMADTHYPWVGQHAHDAIADAIRIEKPDRIVHVGDLLDQYALSNYAKNPNAMTAKEEFAQAQACVQELYKIVGPKLDILSSNHDDRLYKRGTVAGIPKEFLKPYKQLIKAPAGWRYHDDLTLTVDSTRERIYFRHTASGSTMSVAKLVGMTTVLAHHHSKFGIQAITTPHKTHYAVDTGCLISDKGYAFGYNKGSVLRPSRGIGIIEAGIPRVIPVK